MSAAIRVHGLVRDFGAVRALDGLSFEVPTGIVFGFLGPNGAGKTTVIRTLLGLVQPTEGSAEVLGHDTVREGASIRGRSGALLEHNGLYERLTAEQNLEFYGRVWRLSSNERKARTRELLTQFGLWDRRTDLVGTWSRGMRQKLAVARAVLHRPVLIFLDEPTAGLDPVASAMLRDDLAALSAREGVTIFLTTHNLLEAERLCTLIGVIRTGRLVALGSPSTLRAREELNDVRIVARPSRGVAFDTMGSVVGVERVRQEGETWIVTLGAGQPAAPVVRHLVAHGVDVEEVRRDQPSLEEAFLDLVNDAPSGAP